MKTINFIVALLLTVFAAFAISTLFNIHPAIVLIAILFTGLIVGRSANGVLLSSISPDLMQALDQLKAELKRVTTAEAKAEIDKQIKEVETRFTNVENSVNLLFQKESQITIPDGGNRSGIAGAVSNVFRNNEGRIREFFAKKTAGDLILETKAAGDMTIGGNITGGSVSVSAPLPGIVPNASRKVHIGQLLPRININGDLVVLVENGPGEGSIGPVLETGTKPQKDFNLIEKTFVAHYIAGWTRASRKFMLTVNGAMDFLNNRLTEEYYKTEDNLLLNGDGVAPNPGGINMPGNFTPASSLPGDNDYIQLLSSISQLRSMDRNPDLIILSVTDLYNLMANQASGSMEFDQPGVVQIDANGGMRIAGVPVIATTAQTVGIYNVLDRSGYIIGEIEGLNIRLFEQDADNVIKNMVTVRIESLISFAVLGPTYAIKGTFTVIP